MATVRCNSTIYPAPRSPNWNGQQSCRTKLALDHSAGCTGLGLSISYDIVTQQHGGTITVDSQVGEFTEFTVRLPRH
jgi:signal transduction histidine kinase